MNLTGEQPVGASNDEAVDQVYEVEDILRYRRNSDGTEFFLVKWVGYPASEATWEPLGHMNEDCRELIAKARALFAWNRTGPSAPVQVNNPSSSSRLSDELSSRPISDNNRQTVDVESVEDSKQAQKRPRADSGVPGKRARHPADPASMTGGATVSSSSQVGVPPRPTVKASEVPHEAAFNGAASPVEEVQRPRVLVAKEMKCSCGQKQLPPVKERSSLIVCKSCHSGHHRECLKNVIHGPVPEEYYCPTCRVEKVDEFHPLAGQGILGHTFASSASKFVLNFTAAPQAWKKQGWSVHLRSVALKNALLLGPAWPHQVHGKLNGKTVVAIEPPKHLHLRREQCYNLTPLLKQGQNSLEMTFTPNTHGESPDQENFCVAVVVTKQRPVEEIIKLIKQGTKDTVATGKARVFRILSQVKAKEAHQDECMVTGSFGRALKPLCPVSHCRIEDAAVGQGCNHVQVFDLRAYIAVNQRMRALDKRWTCPVCSSPIRPEEVILDPFAQEVLDSVRGKEDTVDHFVFNEDCTWAAVAPEKNAPGGADPSAPVAQPADLIALSDSDDD